MGLFRDIKQIIEMEHNIFKNPTQLVGDKLDLLTSRAFERVARL